METRLRAEKYWWIVVIVGIAIWYADKIFG